MVWEVIYHPDVTDDLDSIGAAEARRILKAIDERIINGSPDKTGKPLRGNLAGCRRIRTGSYRIIYKADDRRIEVLILAVGPRRNKDAYKTAGKRA
ncbi:MAG: type II toxin-antitoxin system RelE/ParE family toxin [Gammaproteobacteria bacterium]|nr:type II toxin-antitoxin system RelE/ParE family toxin [Gammaproteobacteria bacterium]